MEKQYQVTLLTKEGNYKPVSALVKCSPKNLLDKNDKKSVITAGIIKICQKRTWTQRDLTKYGYTLIKVREYDKEKIEKEKAERYEKIKEEKYAFGEWKKPKNKG